VGIRPAAASREAGERSSLSTSGGRFPEGFLWGTASAAHQVEGDDRNCDWWEFEQQPGRIANGDTSEVACDHYSRYREDFALLREMNQNAHRLSIEWSRIEPAEGVFDSRQIRHYRDVLGELREQAILPMVTLHHFTSPLWFTRKGGWVAPDAPSAFLAFAANGWLVGEFPPAHQGDIAGMYRVTSNLYRAHELAYVAIKKRWPDAPVGLSHHKFYFLPASNKRRDKLAAGTAQLALDRWPVAPGRLRKIVEATSDYIGIAHYWGQMVAFDPRRAREQFIRRFNVPGLPVTEMGWSADPGWMREVLNELRPLGKPVYITENGYATHDDAVRQQYITDVLTNVQLAIGDGVDVRGYFHWTNTDNFEWARGYTQQLGLIAVDRKTLERTVKPSGRLYARIAATNSLPIDSPK
jgi:beta-glucosidase